MQYIYYKIYVQYITIDPLFLYNNNISLCSQDQSGFLDEDEFRYAIEYLKLPINDELLENLFFQYDYNYTGKIDYIEFREIYLQICDLRKELEDRDIDLPH